MNALTASDSSNWIGDGSDGNLTVEGYTISFGSNKKGTPFNIRVDDGSIDPSKSSFYEVEIVELTGNIGVGAITKDLFLPGWKSKGVFFNGNLTNGSAALLCGFGDWPKVGDTIGVFIKREEDVVRVIFYLNGRCLGEGFRLEEETGVFFPCLHLDGSSVVKYRVPDEFPSETSRQPSHRADPYCGDWKLVKAFDGPELGERPLPEGSNIVLNFHPSDDASYRLSVKVGNSLNTTVKITGKLEAFDTIEVGMVASTMMMPPPELFEVEQYLNSSLPQLKKMIISESGELIMSGATAELQSKTYEKEFEPLTKY